MLKRRDLFKAVIGAALAPVAAKVAAAQRYDYVAGVAGEFAGELLPLDGFATGGLASFPLDDWHDVLLSWDSESGAVVAEELPPPEQAVLPLLLVGDEDGQDA